MNANYVPGYRRVLPATRFYFGGGVPAPPKPPAPPTTGQAANNASNAMKKKRSGYASTILTLGQPSLGGGSDAAKTLLGS